MPRVFFKMMLFMKLYVLGKCTGITFDCTMLPVCHNVRRYFNKVFAGLAKNGKDISSIKQYRKPNQGIHA